jgi:hypothetical protein
MNKQVLAFVQVVIILFIQFLFIVDFIKPFDYQGYNACFIESGFDYWEPAFGLICDITSSIRNPFLSLLVGRLISVFPTIVLFILLSKKNIYASLYIFISLFGLILGGYRQLIASSLIGIVFILSNKNKIKRFFLILLACITHYSTIPAIFIFFFLKKINFNKQKLFFITIILLLAPYTINYIISHYLLNFLSIPGSWLQYLSGTYVVESNSYYFFAKIILMSQSLFAIFLISYNRPKIIPVNHNFIIALEIMFCAMILSTDYIITARFAIFIRILEMRYILMEPYNKKIKLILVLVVLLRLITLLNGASLQ